MPKTEEDRARAAFDRADAKIDPLVKKAQSALEKAKVAGDAAELAKANLTSAINTRNHAATHPALGGTISTIANPFVEPGDVSLTVAADTTAAQASLRTSMPRQAPEPSSAPASAAPDVDLTEPSTEAVVTNDPDADGDAGDSAVDMDAWVNNDDEPVVLGDSEPAFVEPVPTADQESQAEREARELLEQADRGDPPQPSPTQPIPEPTEQDPFARF